MKEETKEILVAVYGTLRKDSGNHRILRDSPTAKFVGMHTTKPEFTMFSLGGFPGLKKQGNTPIITEIYSVSDERTKQRLDMLEGYHGPDSTYNMYDKDTIETEWGDAEIYIYAGRVTDDRIIESGDWYNRTPPKVVSEEEE